MRLQLAPLTLQGLRHSFTLYAVVGGRYLYMEKPGARILKHQQEREGQKLYKDLSISAWGLALGNLCRRCSQEVAFGGA